MDGNNIDHNKNADANRIKIIMLIKNGEIVRTERGQNIKMLVLE